MQREKRGSRHFTLAAAAKRLLIIWVCEFLSAAG